ncbi:MAG: hypothetical protein JST50_02865 [Bacteroidetes bacterium]|jgi:hypothetical protein|nr:hypothetical protein [Bacteroidota bacterium]
MSNYNPEKIIWTEDDFIGMNWEGARIRACCFNKKLEIAFDIDYVFERVKSKKSDKYSKFWIAPCTLVFENVYEIYSDFNHLHPTMTYISRNRPRSPENLKSLDRGPEYDWYIHYDGGLFTFTSVGYKLYVRRDPVATSRKFLKMEERGDVSFNRAYEAY